MADSRGDVGFETPVRFWQYSTGWVETIVPFLSNKPVVGDIQPASKSLGSKLGTVDAKRETKIVKLIRCECGSTDRTIGIAGEWIYLAPKAVPDTQG